MCDNTSLSPMTEAEALQYSAASLAYLGDSVLEIFVRERLVRTGAKSPSVKSLEYVTAGAQSRAVENILPILTEFEADQFRRGRNCVHSGVPKHATMAEYRRATGLETLFGALHMLGRTDRLRLLFETAYPEA